MVAPPDRQTSLPRESLNCAVFRGSHVSTFLPSSLSLCSRRRREHPSGFQPMGSQELKASANEESAGVREGQSPVVRLVLFDCQLSTFLFNEWMKIYIFFA